MVEIKDQSIDVCSVLKYWGKEEACSKSCKEKDHIYGQKTQNMHIIRDHH